MVKLWHASIILATVSAEFTQKCPEIPGKHVTFQLRETQSVTLDRVDEKTSLCTLSLEPIDEKGVLIPIARTYDGNDWERTGGSFAAKLEEWTCGGVKCSAVLPGNSGIYFLHRRAVTSSNEVVRFLEQASFGASRDDLKTWNNKSFTHFVKEQTTVKPTLHREYFRRRVNKLWQYHQPEFSTALDPCETNDSYWYQAAIGARDRLKTMTAQRVGDRWKIAVDGELRSMPKVLRFENKYRSWNDEIEDGGSYEICSLPDELFRGIYRVRSKSGCRALLTSDLQIQFPEDSVPVRLFPKPLAMLSDDSVWRQASSWTPEYMYAGALPKAGCSEYPKVKGVNSPPLFARTDAGEWLMYYPRILLMENSMDHPLGDGGVDVWSVNGTTACSNVPRTFQNEESCFMSSKPACAAVSEEVGHPGTGVLVCGSPGEVQNDPSLGDNWIDVGALDRARAVSHHLPDEHALNEGLEKQREMLWTDIALFGKDQLRQKVAWALYHILAVPKFSVGRQRRLTEIFSAYYDIFVRHAFGNYRDVLKEIAFNPLMAESLTFLNSRSVGNTFTGRKKVIAPDENFARELMQLFTIGLVKLNMDGTPVLDADKNTIPTYSNEQIMSFASVWTGFVRQKRRSNIEGRENKIDPLDIEAGWRDVSRQLDLKFVSYSCPSLQVFPKPDLSGGYLGDRYPLCSELPKQLFLRTGAKYRLLGSTPLSHTVHDCRKWAEEKSTVHIELSPDTTGLFEKLCGNSGTCAYPGVVVLDDDMSCDNDGAQECQVDTVRVLKVGDAFYEFVPNTPCVHHAFMENGQTVTGRTKWSHAVCVNPNYPVASEACCQPTTRPWKEVASRACAYAGERMLLTTAQKRCEGKGRELCRFGSVGTDADCPHIGHHWTGATCSSLARVRESDGKVAIVQDLVGNPPPLLRSDSQNFFTVYWKNEDYPTPSNDCGGADCEIIGDECVCPVSVVDEAAFTAPPKTSAEVVKELYGGAAELELKDMNKFEDGNSRDFNIYSHGGSCCGSQTIFEVMNYNGQAQFFRNTKSSVFVKGTSFEFRNPPHFMSLVPSEVSIVDAEQETDALLDHLLHQPTTPPFLALRFIQRFGISNPSPRFVLAVSTAFRDGTFFSSDGVSFGSGQYGDLEATIAAIILDREARSISLDDDPHHGSMREPIAKVLAFLRALEFKSTTPLVEVDLLDEKIGQMAFEQASVFSFFRPEYSPPGAVTASGLVAPEAEVMLSGKVIGLLNGLFGLLRHGMASCEDGFGDYGCATNTSGVLAYTPSYSTTPSIVSELAEILTAGRLGEERQKVIVDAVGENDDIMETFRKATELIVTAPEFHSTNKVDSQSTASASSTPESDANQCDRYKVVIHFSFLGGCDSFNMLVPHSSCDLHAQYKDVRDELALSEKNTLKLEGGNLSGQPCSSFAVHHRLETLRDLYNDGDAVFLANAGALSQPVTKENYRYKTNIKLFGHNTMTDEIDSLDPYDGAVGTGSLGRMADATHSKGCRSVRTAVASIPRNLVGRASMGDPVFSLDEKGVSPFLVESDQVKSVMSELNKGGTGVFGDTWSTLFSQAVNQTEDLEETLLSATTHEAFPSTRLGKRFKLIAQLIGARGIRGVDRDYFYVPLGGFDTHSNGNDKLDLLFDEVNDVLSAFVSEMKHLGVWDDVVLIQTSDFGRSLSPNSGGGSDHGWGGNYFMMGGGLKQSGVLGDYPSNLKEGDHILDRGRVVPTMPFEAPFQAIAQWVGIESDSELDSIFPNRNKFDNLFNKEDLFHP